MRNIAVVNKSFDSSDWIGRFRFIFLLVYTLLSSKLYSIRNYSLHWGTAMYIIFIMIASKDVQHEHFLLVYTLLLSKLYSICNYLLHWVTAT